MTSGAPRPAPIRVGVLYDFPQADAGALFEEALRLGVDEVASTGRIDREIELVSLQAQGLPAGTARDVEQCFAQLHDAGVLAVIGPSVSDNGLIVRKLADDAELPCINYTGGEVTRGLFMFHYQVGSLEEEPVVLARHLSLEAHRSAAVVHDQSPVGRLYAQSFAEACPALGLEVVATASVPPLTEDVSAVVPRLRTADPGAVVYLGLGVAARALALGIAAEEWKVPVVANSALMFGYARKDWRAGWEGWTYLDTISDENSVRQRLAQRSPRSAAGPIGVAAYDIGRLVAEALARTAHLTREGIRDALEKVKQVPAASGMDGTVMGFGNFDHGALKGRYLVLRRWEGGKSRQVADQ